MTGTTDRVSTLELFFDLVFVFTITQVARLVSGAHGADGLGSAALILTIAWWMYGGYAWLTNAVVPSNTMRRGLLVVGMAGFLTMALAVPDAFDTTGWAFGLGYFVVNLVHSGLFLLSGGPSAATVARAIIDLRNMTTSFTMLAAKNVAGGGLLHPGGRNKN